MEILFGIIILILSVVVHEVSHGYAADALGDPTARLAGRLTLNPIRHLDLFGSLIIPAITWMAGGFIFGWAKPVPFNPYNFQKGGKWGEALVAAAGPASNLVLATVFGLLIRFAPLPMAAIGIVSFVVIINIILALFNLIPVPPLDGSKILFTFLPHRYGQVRMMFERYGLILVLLFVLFLWRLIIPVVSFVFTLLTGITF